LQQKKRSADVWGLNRQNQTTPFSRDKHFKQKAFQHRATAGMEIVYILLSCEHFHISLSLSHQLVRVFGLLTQ